MREMMRLYSVIILTMGIIAGPAYAQDATTERAEKGSLSEECLIDYREVRESLYGLRECSSDDECQPQFFTFPFGPERCIFYGIGSDEGQERLKQVQSEVDGFIQKCALDQPDYQAWKKEQEEGFFKKQPEDCYNVGMFAQCVEGRCVTKSKFELYDPEVERTIR